jgi:radical SAM PhpK family P-methyltransferase
MPFDCVVVGYNDPPFDRYEQLLRSRGLDSEAYRDLRLSFVEINGQPLTYIDLLNHVRMETTERMELSKTFYSGGMPNLAAAYLTSFLRRSGFSADYINLFQPDKEKLARYLAEGVRAVAITTTFYVINVAVIEIVEFVRQCNPEIKIIVGGPLIANHARRYGTENCGAVLLSLREGPWPVPSALQVALDEIGADIYVIEGQGEATLARVIDCLRSGKPVRPVPNLVYQEAGVYWRTATQPEDNDLDRTDVDWSKLSAEPLGHSISLRTARSCAFQCSFCNYPNRAGKLKLSALETIKRELDSIRRLDDVRHIAFVDDTFNVPLDRFKEICRLMIRERYGFEWYSYFRCSNSDLEAFDLMAESGCKGVFLGIESGAPSVLKLMNKAAKPEQYEHGIAQLKQRGILTFASFIVGFPGETSETVEQTIALITRAAPDFYRAQLWYCEAGTPVDRRREELGIEGDGFVWRHRTMDSMTASDHIERMFLTIRESGWLPQWSFDFWMIPYLRGEGVGPEQFRGFVQHANRLLALQVASVDTDFRRVASNKQIHELKQLFANSVCA